MKLIWRRGRRPIPLIPRSWRSWPVCVFYPLGTGFPTPTFCFPTKCLSLPTTVLSFPTPRSLLPIECKRFLTECKRRSTPTSLRSSPASNRPPLITTRPGLALRRSDRASNVTATTWDCSGTAILPPSAAFSHYDSTLFALGPAFFVPGESALRRRPALKGSETTFGHTRNASQIPHPARLPRSTTFSVHYAAFFARGATFLSRDTTTNAPGRVLLVTVVHSNALVVRSSDARLPQEFRTMRLSFVVPERFLPMQRWERAHFSDSRPH